eukprot:TCONS_00061738-protein
MASFVLMLMSLERFIAIRYPFKTLFFNRKHVLTCYIIIWIYSIGLFILMEYHYSEINLIHMSLSNVLPLVVNSVVYVYIQKQVLRHLRDIKSKRVNPGTTSNQNRESKRHYKKNVIFIYIMVTFFVLWIPYICYRLWFRGFSGQEKDSCYRVGYRGRL